MKREDFFKEMTAGLIKTFKNVYEPFVEEDMKKLEKTTDQFLGINWFYVCNEYGAQQKLNQFIVNGRPIIIINEGGNVQAISGICPECSNLLTLSVLFSTCKCFNCEKEYNFQKKQGELSFSELPLTMKKDGYHVGLKK